MQSHFGGAVRTCDPRVTIARLKPLLSKAGITRVANVTGLDCLGIPTFVVVRPLARSLSVAQGKGITNDLAIASGIMESIETHHAEHHVPRGHVAPLSEAIRDDFYVSPVELPYRRDAHLFGNPLIEWIAAHDLTSDVIRYVPRDIPDLDSTTADTKSPLFIRSSNGLASGNTRTEAILHAVCEIIERDQLSFWLVRRDFLRLPCPSRVGIGSVDDTICGSLIEKIHKAGLEIAIWRVATSIQIPNFLCVIFDQHGRTAYPLRSSGYGCHPLRQVALSRAITEAAQSRLTYISGARDDVYSSKYQVQIRADHPEHRAFFNEIRREEEELSFSAISQYEGEVSIERMIDWTLHEIAADSLATVLVTDLKCPDFSLDVVHVLIPGVEFNIRSRVYAPGGRMAEFLRQHGH